MNDTNSKPAEPETISKVDLFKEMQKVFDGMQKMSNAPVQKYKFIRDGHHISARVVGGPPQSSSSKGEDCKAPA